MRYPDADMKSVYVCGILRMIEEFTLSAAKLCRGVRPLSRRPVGV